MAVEPDQPGAQHRAGHDRGRQRRPVEEDHRRRQGRDPRAQEHHQHDGRSAELASPRGHARRAEVGTEGKLGGQAEVPGVAGVWKDLTDNVNFMARNLTTQVRGIVKVVTAVANGDLKQKLVVEAKGEIAALAETINNMTDTLSHVRRAGHDGRARGRHRRQARRPGARARRRRHLEGPDRQRQLHGLEPDDAGARHRQGRHRGRQRRPVAEAASSRRKGEIAALADTINNMTDTLRHLRRAGHDGGARGRHRRQARRPGEGAGRRRHLARADRQRQPARRQPDHPGARDRRGRHRGDQGRPDPVDRRSRRRARSPRSRTTSTR